MKRVRRKNKNGVPTAHSAWDSDRPRQAYELCLLGQTDQQMADVMGISVKTIEYWKSTKPEFADACRRGKTSADARVAEALFRKAVGYTKEEEVVSVYKGEVTKTTIMKYYPPDAWACMKWLGLRQRENWTDVQRTETTQTNINVQKLDLSGIPTDELMLLRKIGLRQAINEPGNGSQN